MGCIVDRVWIGEGVRMESKNTGRGRVLNLPQRGNEGIGVLEIWSCIEK
jgi:hypothetical protein